MGPLSPSDLLKLAVQMLELGATSFDVSTGSVAFAASTVANHAAHKHQLVRDAAQAARLAEAGDAEDVKRLMADEAKLRRIHDHMGSA